MMENNRLVSIIFLFIYLLLSYKMSLYDVIYSIFPTYFGTYWFITCYIILYLASPYMNIVINSISKKEHATLCIVLLAVYFILSNLIVVAYYDGLVIFFVSYFLVAYIKRYCDCFSENIRLNLYLLFLSVFLFVGGLFLVNFIGLKISVLSNEMSHWDDIRNPFIFMLSLSAFNVFRKINMKNSVINYLSSFSMMAYITHGNILFCKFTRTIAVNNFVRYFGYENVILSVILVTLLLYIFSFASSILYKMLFNNYISKLSEKILTFLKQICAFIDA